MRTSFFVAALASVAVIPAGASATILAPTSTTFYFSGSCTDCAVAAGKPVTALAELVLSNYALGQTINYLNFVSFHYDGTNLIPGGFTITNATATFLSGSIDVPLPGPENFSISNSTYLFSTNRLGVWSVAPGFNRESTLDVGVGGTVSTNAPAAAAPEPASWAMMIAGFGMIGAALRRRSVTVRFA